MITKRLLVCDLDNTLYDWVSYFVPSFYSMVDVASQILSCNREQLLDDLKIVHQRHHDSEHPFALLETRTVRERYKDMPLKSVASILDPAFHAFNKSRNTNLELFNGVIETLEYLFNHDIRIVAHTESRLHGALDRIHRLNISKYFTKIYCRERTTTNPPDDNAAKKWLAKFSFENIRELSQHQSKPNPEVLLEICAAENVSITDTAYVGDSIVKDVMMAKRAGVFAIWAAYGTRHDESLYAALVRVSHWTDEEVMRERQLRSEAISINPDYVAEKSFSEVILALEAETKHELKHAIN